LIVKLKFAAVYLLAVCGLTYGGDWPQWGGKNDRNMVSPEVGLPETFTIPSKVASSGPIDMTGSKNLRWAAQVGVNCYGSPVISQGKVLVATSPVPYDTKYTGNRGTILCLDEKTGAFIWQYSVQRPNTGNLAGITTLGFCNSPTVDGDRVYALGWADVVCLALDGQKDKRPSMPGETAYIAGKDKITLGETDAKVLWRFDIVKEMGIAAHDTLASCALVVGDLVFVSTGNGVKQDHKTYSTPDAPCFIALDKNTGKLVAVDDEKIGGKTFHGQWSSPTLATIDGKQQIIWGGGDGVCYSFDPVPVEVPGQTVKRIKKIWSRDLNYEKNAEGVLEKNTKAYKAKGGPSEIISTPIVYDGKVYVSTGQDWTHAIDKAHLTCLDPTKTGEAPIIWDRQDIPMQVSTPAIADGLLYTADLRGKVWCIDAATGKDVWVNESGAQFRSSCLIADGKVYIPDSRGKLFVFAHGREKKLLATIDLKAAAAGMPVAANGTLYVATARALFAAQK
jgi:outer membrane protein assembly factor BamB